MRRRRRDRGVGLVKALVAGAALLALVASAAGLSGADYSSATASRGELAAAADWVAPLLSLADPGPVIGGSVQLVATASDQYGSGVASVRIERSPAGAGSWTPICTATAPPYSCVLDTTALANDYYDLRAVATDKAGFTAADLLSEVQVDNRPSSVTMLDPGSPLSGVITLAAEASDADSGIATVTIQRSPAGKGSWSEVCTVATPPYSCRFDTRTVAEGSYELRAVASDSAGNVTASAPILNRRIDNTVNSISLEDPGAYLRGTVNLVANASSTAGVTAVTIQRSPAGKSSWSEICRDTSSPYGCAWDTTTVAEGSYDLRAVLTTGAGATLYSAVLSARQVDNTPVRGLDVQAVNRVGGTAGRIESGDSVAFTYSTLMSPSSILPGWSGTAPTSIYLRLRDGNLLGTGGSGDTLQFSTDASGNNQLRLGSVNLHGDYVKNNKTSVFAATIAASTQVAAGISQTVVTVTVGSLASGGALRTSTVAAQMAWTPAAGATALNGSPVSLAPVLESGALDRDF